MNWYLFGAIALIIGLVALFFVLFVVYKRMPAPAGCENIKPSNEKCGGCSVEDCPFYARFSAKEDK